MPLPMPSARPDFVNGGDWHALAGPPDRSRPSSALTEAARRHILELADTCSTLSDQMRLMAEAHGGWVSRHDPAFAALVRDFAAAFTLLTAAVDDLQERKQDWEQYIADSRVLRALRAGLAGWEKHSRAGNADAAHPHP